MRCVVLLCDHSQNQWVIADLLVKAKADLDVISHKVHECDVQCLYGICTLMQALHATGTARHGIPMPHRLRRSVDAVRLKCTRRSHAAVTSSA